MENITEKEYLLSLFGDETKEKVAQPKTEFLNEMFPISVLKRFEEISRFLETKEKNQGFSVRINNRSVDFFGKSHKMLKLEILLGALAGVSNFLIELPEYDSAKCIDFIASLKPEARTIHEAIQNKNRITAQPAFSKDLDFVFSKAEDKELPVRIVGLPNLYPIVFADKEHKEIVFSIVNISFDDREFLPLEAPILKEGKWRIERLYEQGDWKFSPRLLAYENNVPMLKVYAKAWSIEFIKAIKI